MRTAVLSLWMLSVFASACSAENQARLNAAGRPVSASLTVYQQNLALVREVRNVRLTAGGGTLAYENVAAQVQPSSIQLRSLSQPGGFSTLEQNYQYGLVDPNHLLEKFVGKKIKLVEWNQYQDRREVVEAELLSTRGPVYRIGSEVYIGHPGIPILPELPENVLLKPSITWRYENSGGEDQKLELTYMTGGFGWTADYLLTIGGDEKTARLDGWFNLDNRSGTRYEDARLKLVAGNLNRNQAQPAMLIRKEMAMMAADAGGESFQQQAFSDYHQYDLKRPVTLEDQEAKQIRFVEVPSVMVEKSYRVFSNQGYYQASPESDGQKQPVQIFVRLNNSEKNRLGIPMPAGSFKVYAEDHDGQPLWIGEDTIRHTAKDEEIELKVGEAFDLAVKRKQTDFRQLSQKMSENGWEIEIKNHKESDAVVEIHESLYGTWEIFDTDKPYEKINSQTARFTVKVPKGGTEFVRYRVRVGI